MAKIKFQWGNNYVKPTTQDSLDLYNYYKLQKSLEKPSQVRKTTPEEYKKTNQVLTLNEEGIQAKNKLNKLALEILQRNKNIKPGAYPQSIKDKTVIIDGQKVTVKQPKYTDEQRKKGYLESGSFDIYHPSIKPKGYWQGAAENNDYSNVNPIKLPKPTRPAPVKIDKIEPKQASFNFTPPEDNRKLNMVPTSNYFRAEGAPSLSYPAMNQGFFGRMKSKITGKNPMPYWMDKQGVKRYPHLGENNPEQVKQIQMLKGDLNPKVPEEGAELKRIDKLLADPALRNKMATSFQNGVREANSYTFGKEPGVGRAIGKVLTGFADDKGKGYSISPSEVMKNLAMPASLLSSCTVDKRVGYHPQKNPHKRGWNQKFDSRCGGPKR